MTCKEILAYHPPVGDVFKALADPTRRAILDELAERDEQSLFELCTRLTMRHGSASTRQAVSQHLDLLEAAGLVRARRSGRTVLHTLVPAPLHDVEATVDRWLGGRAKQEPPGDDS